MCFCKDRSPVIRTLVSANPRLNFNPGFFFLLSKALSQIIFFLLFLEYPVIKLNLLFKLLYLSSNFAQTLG